MKAGAQSLTGYIGVDRRRSHDQWIDGNSPKKKQKDNNLFKNQENLLVMRK